VTLTRINREGKKEGLPSLLFMNRGLDKRKGGEHISGKKSEGDLLTAFTEEEANERTACL